MTTNRKLRVAHRRSFRAVSEPRRKVERSRPWTVAPFAGVLWHEDMKMIEAAMHPIRIQFASISPRGELWSAPSLDPEEKGEGGQTDACRKRRTGDSGHGRTESTNGARAEETQSRASAPEQEHRWTLCTTVRDGRMCKVASVYISEYQHERRECSMVWRVLPHEPHLCTLVQISTLTFSQAQLNSCTLVLPCRCLIRLDRSCGPWDAAPSGHIHCFGHTPAN